MRPIFLLLAFLMHSQILVVTACRSSSLSSSPTAATPPPLTATSTATMIPPATPTVALPATAIETTATLNLAPFTLTLPEPWSALRPRADEWQRQVQTLAAIQPALAQAAEALLAMQPATTTVVLAWPGTTQPAITLVAAVTPAEDVSLQTYVATAAAELQQPAITGAKVTMHSASIRYDLHPEQLPLAILHYTMPASDSATAPIITGYQAMTIDKTAAHMILLTFTIHDAQPAAALAVIESIVATLQEK